jgi:hypothetical protein
MDDDLTAWLRAQLDDDERIAQRAGGTWREDGEGTGEILCSDSRVAENLISARIEGLAPHITRHDPARVLREIKSKRLIVRECENQAAWESTAGRKYPATTAWALAVTTLRLLALPYSDRPGYREEWKP